MQRIINYSTEFPIMLTTFEWPVALLPPAIYQMLHASAGPEEIETAVASFGFREVRAVASGLDPLASSLEKEAEKLQRRPAPFQRVPTGSQDRPLRISRHRLAFCFVETSSGHCRGSCARVPSGSDALFHFAVFVPGKGVACARASAGRSSRRAYGSTAYDFFRPAWGDRRFDG